ncbi:MAG: transglycosylase SLT domain-containing protein [bacterium]|nr:transglycosylase SLT domain-containing protein [bacterium]
MKWNPMFSKNQNYKLLFIIIVFLSINISAASGFNDPGYQDSGELAAQGDNAYRLLRFDRAFEFYNSAVEQDESLKTDQLLLMKIAMSAFHQGEYETAAEYFRNAKGKSNTYNDYIDYYTALSLESLKKSDEALEIVSVFKENHPGSRVGDEAANLAGMILNARNDFSGSNEFFLQIKDSNNLKFGTEEVILCIGCNFIMAGDLQNGFSYLHDVMEDSPRDSTALKAADFLVEHKEMNNSGFSEKDLLLLSTVYTSHRKYTKAEKYLTDLFSNYSDGDYIGRAHYERGKYRFARSRYTRSLSDFQNAFEKLKDPGLIRESRFYLARAKLNKGDRAGAIVEYDRYARSYPTGRHAGESLWMIGLLYERQGAMTRAIEAYNRVAEESRSISYRDRAVFRVGFNYYKNDRLTEAKDYFNTAKNRYPGTELARRCSFWEAKALEKLGKSEEADQILNSLASQKARSYYIIKAREKTGQKFEFTKVDDLFQSKSGSNEINKAVNIGMIFGEPWGSRELRTQRRSAGRDLKSLIEIYNAYIDMGRYRSAVSLADFIFNRYYYGKNNIDAYKSLYPLFFGDLISEIPTAKRLGKALIFSVIRRESLFEHDAISSAGAIGLMQLMPHTANILSERIELDDFKTEDTLIPEINLRLGIQNLFELSQRFRRNKPQMLAAYNAGDDPTRRWMRRHGTEDMDEWIENVEYSETQTFIKEVLKNYYYFSNLYPELNDTNGR